MTERRWLVGIICSVGIGCAAPSQPDGTSGEILPRWQTDVGSSPTGLRIAAFVASTVIVGAKSAIVGLDVASGAQKWTLAVPFDLPYAGLVVVNDTLSALVTGDGFITFDPRTGRPSHSWTNPAPLRYPSGTIPQRAADDRIIFASHDLNLLALNPHNGMLDTLAKLPGLASRHAYVAAITLYNDTIYAPVASDASRGAAYKNTVTYRLSLHSRTLDSLRPDPSDSASLARWMIATKDQLFSATDYSEPSWLGFDRSTGLRKWKVAATGGSLGPSSQVALVRDTMFAGGNDGVGYVVDVPSGRRIRSFTIPSGLVDGVVACGDQVIINVIGQMFAYSRDGLRRSKVGGLVEGKDSFLGFFATGSGVAVIGNGAGFWMALPCAPAT